MESIKSELHKRCVAFVDERIRAIESEIQTAQASANEETKSSSGDKYETGRAMMQLEIEKNLGQLAEAQKLKKLLQSIHPENYSTTIQNGSLIVTDQSIYYLSIAIGVLNMDNKTYFVISSASPIGTKMLGLKAGDSFAFNNKTHHIKEVL